MGFLDRLRRRAPTASAATPVFRQAPSHARHRGSVGSIKWVPAGQPVRVAGRTIPGGMLFVGSRASSGDTLVVEPALVDPGLPVSWERPDQLGTSMGYWPSYSSLTPEARAAYLTWLLGGRSQPGTYIGFVFLYFYGLERRFLVDLKAISDHPESHLIAEEVRRLVAIYGDDASFRSYATVFLAMIDTVAAKTAPLEPPNWDTFSRHWEVPAVVRVALGRYVGAKEPIPAEWALVLLRLHPEAYLRTPATRCTDEFDELFIQRFRARFGDGIVVRIPQERVEVIYRPASGGLDGTYSQRLEDIPDVCSSNGLLNKLREVESSCTDALDAYSRYLGRNPDGADEPAALGLLPDELLATRGGPGLADIRTWGASVTAGGQSLIPTDELVERWGPGRTAKLTKRDAVSLAALLGKFNLGIEPDVRFGGRTPSPASTVVLFPLPEHAPSAPSPQYAAAGALVHLTAVVASSDGTVSDDERLHLAQHLEASLGLDAAERARLKAHFAWLTVGKPSLAGVKSRLDSLSSRQRSTIGLFLVDLAAADGVVSPVEITTLTKLYKLLGLEDGDVYRRIHSLGADTGPVTVQAADLTAPRYAIPGPPTEPQAIQLDPAKVRARLAETATVTALLADIFRDDDNAEHSQPAVVAAATVTHPSGPVIDGLDAAHSALAGRLRTQSTWGRADAEIAAVDSGLPLLAGALDRINEAAIDICGEPLLDGYDPLEINDYAAQELYS